MMFSAWPTWPGTCSPKTRRGKNARHGFARQFRQLVGHPRIVPYLADFLGNQFRYDHGHAMLMRKGGGPFELHGGGVPRELGRFESERAAASPARGPDGPAAGLSSPLQEG